MSSEFHKLPRHWDLKCIQQSCLPLSSWICVITLQPRWLKLFCLYLIISHCHCHYHCHCLCHRHHHCHCLCVCLFIGQVMSPSLPAAGSALSHCRTVVKSKRQLERTKDSQLCRIGNTFCTSLQLWLWTPHNICCTLFIIYNFAQLCTILHKCTLCKSRSAVQIAQNFQRTQLSLELQPRSDNAAGCFLKREIEFF